MHLCCRALSVGLPYEIKNRVFSTSFLLILIGFILSGYPRISAAQAANVTVPNVVSQTEAAATAGSQEHVMLVLPLWVLHLLFPQRALESPSPMPSAPLSPPVPSSVKVRQAARVSPPAPPSISLYPPADGSQCGRSTPETATLTINNTCVPGSSTLCLEVGNGYPGGQFHRSQG